MTYEFVREGMYEEIKEELVGKGRFEASSPADRKGWEAFVKYADTQTLKPGEHSRWVNVASQFILAVRTLAVVDQTTQQQDLNDRRIAELLVELQKTPAGKEYFERLGRKTELNKDSAQAKEEARQEALYLYSYTGNKKGIKGATVQTRAKVVFHQDPNYVLAWCMEWAPLALQINYRVLESLAKGMPEAFDEKILTVEDEDTAAISSSNGWGTKQEDGYVGTED